ncbi:MAG: tRNA uridine-5-carboxymethylaminomethyl(34) synthesis enzyme MnmG [Verrucomicrobia bacterium]|nr:tRNA uridine-5-carboxymethylaminomethyl(34) synthesis enzyme MnmG [Verrucomicrobiota bacterium]
MKPYDVIVIGGGHAGCEAALAAARSGAHTALVTMRRAGFATMPCNPAVGGIAKSHLVFEVDALGGEIARNTDCTGVQFRVLNTRRGPAVQANRVQCDKNAYRSRMQVVIDQTRRLEVLDTQAGSIWIENGRLRGITTADGSEIAGKTVVVTTGTFLKGRIHVGHNNRPGGRNDADSSEELSASFRALGFRLGRLKTGTPPRLHRDSLDYSKMEAQPGIDPAPFVSHAAQRESELFHVEQSDLNRQLAPLFHVEQSDIRLRPWAPGANQIPCFITHTNERTHEIIGDNLSRSAMYGGAISGTGVRYCPSIEDKVVKFSDKSSHHVFVEPEGRDNVMMYPNGISNSLPEDVQEAMVHSIVGFENAEFMAYAYAIEYDFSDPRQLSHSLETLLVEGLFFAGQLNGTTGYEEAAAQGFMAGANASRKARGLDPIIISRNEGYIGVLIDDLVTKGIDEPYRMFTSRAERRLILRQDNARFRLLDAAKEIGIVPTMYVDEVARHAREIRDEFDRLDNVRHKGDSLKQLLRRPDSRYADLPGALTELHPEVQRQVDILTKYEGYISREQRLAQKSLDSEGLLLPVGVDYHAFPALRYEAREKLNQVQPESLGQAGRISGVNPADIAILSVLMQRGNLRELADAALLAAS